MTAAHTTLIVTADAFHPASDAVSAQERELFNRATWGLMESPAPLVCRETALELAARAGAVEGIMVAYLGHGDRGLTGIDLRTGSVNVRNSFALEIQAPARRGRVTSPTVGVQQRLAAIMRAIRSGRLPAGRVVLVDRVRGEDRPHAGRTLTRRGTPRVRGEDAELLDVQGRTGNTPACAGKTASCASGAVGGDEHPRVRGEDWYPASCSMEM